MTATPKSRTRWIMVVFALLALLAGLLLLAAVSPAAAKEAPGNGIIVVRALNVRAGPGFTTPVVAVVYQGQTVELLGRTPDFTWFYIQTPNGRQGWIVEGKIATDMSLETLPVLRVAIPVVTPTPEPTPRPTPTPAIISQTDSGIVGLIALASVDTYLLNVRAGPGTDYDVVGKVSRGTIMSLLAKDTRDEWMLVTLPNGSRAWLDGSYIISTVPIGNLPIYGLPIPSPAELAAAAPPVENEPQLSPAVVGAPTEPPIPLTGTHHVSIPSVNIENVQLMESPIVNNIWQMDQITTQAAHLERTAYPGQPGNTVIGAHNELPSGAPGPFARLPDVSIGSTVWVEFDGHLYQYQVFDKQQVTPDRVDMAYPTSDTRLTLITCSGSYIGAGEYTHRTVVIARLIQRY